MRKILLLIMATILLVSAGCDNPQQPPENKTDPPKVTQTEKPDKKPEPEKKDTPAPPKVESARVQTQETKVYYPDESGTKLVPVEREIKFADENEKYSAAINQLMQQPKEKELTTIFPKHAKINSVKREGETAIVDFDKDIAKGFVGGSTGEEFLINSIVDTLTEFKEIEQVKFLIDGQEVETLSGHMDLSEPIKKSQ